MMSAVVYLDYDDFRRIAAATLGVEDDAVTRVTSGEVVERILMGPARLERQLTTSGDLEASQRADLARRAAELVRRIAHERPLPTRNGRLAWTALEEFVRRNGHSLKITDEAEFSEFLTDASASNDVTALGGWIGERLAPSVAGRS